MLVPCFCEPGSSQYVVLLCSLIASAEKNDKYGGPVNEVDAVAGAVVDAHFANALPDVFYVAPVTEREATKTDVDPSSCVPIAKAVNPAAKRFTLDDLVHGTNVTHKLRYVTYRLQAARAIPT